MMLDLPQPLGPTTPTSWPGSMKLVGSAKDLKPDSLIEFRRTKGYYQVVAGGGVALKRRAVQGPPLASNDTLWIIHARRDNLTP